jgi:hypothetical protein
VILQEPLMRANWMAEPAHALTGFVIDHVVGWLLAGFWLAWYLGKKGKA